MATRNIESPVIEYADVVGPSGALPGRFFCFAIEQSWELPMSMLLFGVLALAASVGLLVIASIAIRLDEVTCSECGGNLPVVPLLTNSSSVLSGGWACPKCGTQFNDHGRIRVRA